MPKGYLIAHVQVNDPDAYAAYRDAVPDIAARFGGAYLVRAGASETREGEALPRHVVIEFPSYADATSFYDSPEYAEVITGRTDNADTVLILAEGVDT